MPTTRALNTDPLRSFKFNVIIPFASGINGTLGLARLGFMSMSGLGLSIEPLTYREGGDNITTRKMPGQADFNPITLSRGLFPQNPENWYWMSLLFSAEYGEQIWNNPSALPSYEALPGGIGSAPDFRTYVYINVLQHPNNSSSAPGSQGYVQGTYPVQDQIIQVSFKLYSAWIGSLAYSDLDAGGNAVAVEQMTLNYEGFQTQWGNPYVSFPW